jgi:hypothetical protein
MELIERADRNNHTGYRVLSRSFYEFAGNTWYMTG